MTDKWYQPIAVISGAALLVAGSTALVLSIMAGFGGGEVYGDFDCAPLPGVEVAAETTVDAAGRDYVRVTSRLEISLPRDNPLAPHLLAPPDESAYRGALRCLLGRGREEDRAAEIRESPASATVVGDRLEVVDRVYTDVVGTPDFAVGVVRVTASGPDRWQLTHQPPAALSAARWTRVSVRTPAGWARSPAPAPATSTDVETTWTTDRAGPWSVVVVPDARVAVGAAAVTHPWSVLALALSWLAQVVVAVGLVLWIRRSPTPAGARAEALRLAVPVAVVAVVTAVADVAAQYFLNAPGAVVDLRLVGWVEGAGVLALFGFCAWRWRLRRLPLLALVVAAVGLGALPVVWTYREWPALVAVNPLSVTVKTAFVLVLGTLVAASVAQAFGIARRLDPAHRISRWVWGGAVVVAVLVVLDRLSSDVVNTGRVRWLSPFPLDAAAVCCTFDRYPAQLARDLADPLLLVPVMALWALMKRHVAEVDPVDVRWLKTAAAVLFFVGVVDWGLVVWGWTLPVWSVTAVVVLLVFRRLRSPLDRPMGASTVRENVLGTGLDTLRRHARDVVVTARRRREPDTPRGYDLIGGLTPLDVLLALGPGAEPVANARHAIRYALALGLPVSLLVNGWVWLDGLSFAQRQPGYLAESALLVVWVVVRWWCTGAVVGLLWQHLPGRRGPVKVLPVVLVFAGVRLASDGLLRLADGALPPATPVGVVAFAAVVTATGWLMDRRTLKALRRIG